MMQLTSQMKKELTELWVAAFSDSSSYVKRFFDTHGATGDVVYAKADGKIVSATYLLPETVVVDGVSHRAGYIYAAATLPDYQGLGIMESLISQSYSICRKKGYALCITLPASGGLYGYYEKHGLLPWFTLRRFSFTMDQLQEATPARVIWEKGLGFETYRGCFTEMENGCIQDEATFIHAAYDYLSAGGRAYTCRGARPGYAFVRLDKEKGAKISDIRCDTHELYTLAEMLHARFGVEQFTVTCDRTLPLAAGENEEILPYGSIYVVDPEVEINFTKPAYMNRMLD